MGLLSSKQLDEIYNNSDCIVLPSGYGETWGLVLNEALEYSLPIIVSDMVGGSIDLCKNNGFIFKYSDVEDLANCIKNLYNANDVEFESMRKNSFKIKEKFSNNILDALGKTIMPGIRENARDIFSMTPKDFKSNYRTPFGSGFSIAPILRQSAWFRTHNQDGKYKNLFYVGAGTHPGAGVPGVINSAKAVEKILYP